VGFIKDELKVDTKAAVKDLALERVREMGASVLQRKEDFPSMYINANTTPKLKPVFDELPISDGFVCPLDHCDFATTSVDSFKKHRNTHQQAVKLLPSKCYVQRLSTQHRFFAVDIPTLESTPPMGSLECILSGMTQQADEVYKKQLDDEGAVHPIWREV
jgi:hypothetical protein